MNPASLIRRAALSGQRAELIPWPLRRALLRMAGATVGSGVLVVGGVTVLGGRLTLASGAFINAGVLIDCHAPVTVGENVHVGPRAVILTSDHALGPASFRAGEPGHRPVRIGAGSWVGAGALLLPGISIAPGSVIGAGAVVTRDTEADGLYLGTPARRVRDLAPDPQPGEFGEPRL